MPNAWTLISITEGRQYGGNKGYEDDQERIYRYDSSVANHLQVKAGDLVFVRSRNVVHGMARVKEIRESDGKKTRQKCPTCGTPDIKRRKTRLPVWRCVNGHQFDEATQEEIAVRKYEAIYEDSYLSLAEHLTVEELRGAAFRPNDQLSIEEVNISVFAAKLADSDQQFRQLLSDYFQSSDPDSLHLLEQEIPKEASSDPSAYTLNFGDSRERIVRSIAERRGQAKFRNALFKRYGGQCMISSCGIAQIIEAAHIWPYRGTGDNHVDNGLLLRSDLHTLFDLDLLGIDPQNLSVALHPSVSKGGYELFLGSSLLECSGRRPSVSALEKRWHSFQRRLKA